MIPLSSLEGFGFHCDQNRLREEHKEEIYQGPTWQGWNAPPMWPATQNSPTGCYDTYTGAKALNLASFTISLFEYFNHEAILSNDLDATDEQLMEIILQIFLLSWWYLPAPDQLQDVALQAKTIIRQAYEAYVEDPTLGLASGTIMHQNDLKPVFTPT
jgi:hypothetical protein